MQINRNVRAKKIARSNCYPTGLLCGANELSIEGHFAGIGY